MSSVVLISDLLYQSAGIVFLDGGQVSEELVMVSLAFHLFVVGTVIFASVLGGQEFLYSFKGKCATHKATKTVYICNRVYCIHVPGHDPITFSFRSFSFLIGWDFYGPII